MSVEPTTEDIIERLVQSETCSCSDCVAARAAAKRLRDYQALLDAIGDLTRGWTVREGEMILDRIADAVNGPT